jgi:diguanylate cyclase (GGDEF)-like protein/PAS domain S-box-containing protein
MAGGPLVYLSAEFVRYKEYLEAIVTASPDAICTTDMQGRVMYFSPGAEAMFGRRSADVLGSPVHRLYDEGRPQARRIMRMLLRGGRLADLEVTLKAADRLVHATLSAALLRDRRGGLIGTLAICKDIGERVALEHSLRDLCVTDSLTGLFNRRHFQERGEAEVERARRQRQPLSLILIDIDRFKDVNDRWGHLEGDRMLREAAEAIRASIRRRVDAAFRIGGDEFAALLPGLGASRAGRVAKRIASAAAAVRIAVPLSFGTATLESGDTLRSLISRADALMYAQKRRKRPGGIP